MIGVVFMAIGTTSLIFEINDFERLDAYSAIRERTDYYDTKEFDLKDGQMVNLTFMDNGYTPYEINYEDSIGDKVMISIVENIDYKVMDHGVVVYDDDGWNDGIHALEFIMEGLKNRKLYDFNNSSIVITLSHDNRDRINIEYNED